MKIRLQSFQEISTTSNCFARDDTYNSSILLLIYLIVFNNFELAQIKICT